MRNHLTLIFVYIAELLPLQKSGNETSSNPNPPLGYQDAMDEALIAVEQVVIPRHQAIELLPRTSELLNMQVTMCNV